MEMALGAKADSTLTKPWLAQCINLLHLLLVFAKVVNWAQSLCSITLWTEWLCLHCTVSQGFELGLQPTPKLC